MRLNNKLVLVTGGANGNGAAIAKALAKEGARIAIVDRDTTSGEHTRDEINELGGIAHYFSADLGNAGECRKLGETVLDSLGPIDVLLNNAGVRPRHEFDSSDRDQQWQLAMDVNVNAIRNLSLAFIDSLKTTKGCIINITSIAARNASPMSIAYSTSKAAAEMLTKALALEVAPFGIRVNAIAPGVIETEMTASSRSDPTRSNRLLSRIPLGRFGKPEELAGAVVFLASDMSTYVTGSVIVVDGGYLAV